MTNQFPGGNETVQTLIDYWTGKCTTSTNTCQSQFQENAMVASLNLNYYIKAAASTGSYRHACMLNGKYTILLHEIKITSTKHSFSYYIKL